MTTSTPLQAALALHGQGRLQEAMTIYNRVLADTPADAQALSASGLALHQLGLHDVAAERLERALQIDGAPAQIWVHLAMVYEALDRREQAASALEEALRREPGAADLWRSLAAIYLELGRAADAEAASRQATTLAPSHSATWFNLALSLQALGRVEAALAAAAQAARLAPDSAPPAGLKAQLESSLGLADDARATIRTALAGHPNVGALHIQAAEIEARDGDLAAAARSYASALALDPNDGAVLSELLFLRKRLADWGDLDGLRSRFRSAVNARRAMLTPFSFLSDPSTRAEQRLCAERWSASFLQRASVDPLRPISMGTLRIGYLSADFHQHATAVLTAGLFETHDPRGFRVTGYSTGPDDGSPMRQRLARAFTQLVDARDWPADQLAARIRADGIDILVDLKGHTDNARTGVLALRPAPIQVNYLGYPGTMGAPFIDYLIGDRVVTPFDHGPDYSETLIQLPTSYQINDTARPIVEPPARRDLGLPDDGIVFCCFNSAFKFNPQVFDAWAHILRETPRSVLWLLASTGDAANDAFAANLKRAARARGVDPFRLIFAQRRPYAEYLGLYRRADLFLDTWPYNAHTTASDALWAGCPVLTWIGDTFAGRVAASLLLAVGRPDLIAPSVAHYVDQAIALAGNRTGLARYRAYLDDAGRKSALFDTRATTESLEAAYIEMAAQYRRGVRAPVRIHQRASHAPP